MALVRRIRMRISLLFAIALQLLQGLHGYAWWLLFPGLGPWSLAVPATLTYGGAALVLLDDSQGYEYTSDWARVLTAAFLSASFTFAAVSMCAIGALVLGCFGIIL